MHQEKSEQQWLEVVVLALVFVGLHKCHSLKERRLPGGYSIPAKQ